MRRPVVMSVGVPTAGARLANRRSVAVTVSWYTLVASYVAKKCMTEPVAVWLFMGCSVKMSVRPDVETKREGAWATIWALEKPNSWMPPK